MIVKKISLIFILLISSINANCAQLSRDKTLLTFEVFVKTLLKRNVEIKSLYDDLKLQRQEWLKIQRGLYPNIDINYNNTVDANTDDNKKNDIFNSIFSISTGVSFTTLTGARISAISSSYHDIELGNFLSHPVNGQTTKGVINIKQPLLKGFLYNRKYSSYVTGLIDYKISFHKVENNIGKVILNNIKKYRKYIVDKSNLEILKKNLELHKLQIKVLENKIAKGLAAKEDLNEAMLNLEDELITLLTAENEVADVKSDLAIALNYENLDDFELVEKLDETDSNYDDEQDKMLETAKSNNVDYLSSIDNLYLAKLRHKAAKLELLPSLDLDYEVASNNLADVTKDYKQKISLSGSYTLFDLEDTSNIKAAYIGVKRAKQNLKKQDLIVANTIKNFSLDFKKLKRKLQISKKRLNFAKAAYESSFIKFQKGLISLSDLNQLQDKLLKSQIEILAFETSLLNLIDEQSLFLNKYTKQWRNKCDD